jgi:hypothetical protein
VTVRAAVIRWAGIAIAVCYRSLARPPIWLAQAVRESLLMWVLFVFAFVASMLLAGRMARDGHRSTKAWVWIAAFVGPLGPLALYVLGNRPSGTSHA